MDPNQRPMRKPADRSSVTNLMIAIGILVVGQGFGVGGGTVSGFGGGYHGGGGLFAMMDTWLETGTLDPISGFLAVFALFLVLGFVYVWFKHG